MMPPELLPEKLVQMARTLGRPVPATTMTIVLCALIARREQVLEPDPTMSTALALRRKIGIFSIRRMRPGK
jgi:hypothetical protein